MRLQHQVYAAIQTNDFEMRLDAWERVLPYYFIFNKVNYAWYGSYYIQVLKQIESKYPVTHPVRDAIDQRGGQTINKDAKALAM